jgi:hypothetical protein
MVRILRQPFPIPAHIRPVQMQYVHTKSLDASYLSFDICHGRHVLFGRLQRLSNEVFDQLQIGIANGTEDIVSRARES